jgi:flagellar hook-associated protein 3 FlgL
MSLRLTETIRMSSVNLSEARAAEQLYNASRRAASGLDVEKPSDDPTAYASGTAYQGAIDRLSTRGDTLGQAANTLDIAEGSLAAAGDIVSHARELAVQLASGEVDPQSRARSALEVHTLREQLIGLANTKGPNGYLFAGTANAAQPFTAAGAFVGNDHPIDAEVSDGVTTVANASGARAFTAAGGRDVLADLAALEQALTSNNVGGIQASIDDLEQSHDQLITARSQVGISSGRLRSAADINASTLTTLKSSKASAVEADPVDAYSRLAETRAAYERAIQVTSQILSVSSINR